MMANVHIVDPSYQPAEPGLWSLCGVEVRRYLDDAALERGERPTCQTVEEAGVAWRLAKVTCAPCKAALAARILEGAG